jgi:hypothetical protein
MPEHNPEWREAWPEEPQIELLFQCAAYFYRQSIIKAADAPLETEDSLKPTPEFERRIDEAVKKARRKTAWRKQKAALRKAAVVAAIVILCLTAFPTVLFAVSADFRETVYKYIIDWRQGHVNINIDGQFTAGLTFLKYYIPTFIPDGFVLEDYIDDVTIFQLYYINNEEQYFRFSTYNLTTGISADTETATFYFNYSINGWPAIVSESRGIIDILWHDDITYFSFTSNIPLDTALNIASSYKLYEIFQK